MVSLAAPALSYFHFSPCLLSCYCCFCCAFLIPSLLLLLLPLFIDRDAAQNAAIDAGTVSAEQACTNAGMYYTGVLTFAIYNGVRVSCGTCVCCQPVFTTGR